LATLREGQIRILRVNNNSESNESIMKWLDEEVGGGENGIVIYPNLQTFRQIYTKYVKDKLATKEVEEEKEDDNNIIIIIKVKAMDNYQNQESCYSQHFMKQQTV